MSIKLFLTGNLCNLAKGKDLFEVNGTTVGECLTNFVSLVPAMKRILYYESGNALQGHIKVLVNKKDADVEGLEKKVEAGDEIYIVMLSQH